MAQLKAQTRKQGEASFFFYDAHFKNAAVKILMPSSLQKVAEVAKMAGYQKQVDEFILSMNRAAEAAAPMASRFFGDAIRDMTLEDVRGILTGGNTAATDFLDRSGCWMTLARTDDNGARGIVAL